MWGGEVTIEYLGWSGFRIQRPGGRAILLDPPTASALAGDTPAIVLITHAHPEHLAGVRAHLQNQRAANVTVYASRPVCRYLTRRARGDCVRLVRLHPGQSCTLDTGARMEVFEWRHLPLLPPGWGAGLRHLGRLLARPGLAARIAGAGLAGPRAGPMLGFRLSVAGRRLVAYGEGLHRRCRARAVLARCGGQADGVLLVAAEPEHLDCLPALVAASGMGHALIYEPHAGWRKAFGMPRADLDALACALAARGVNATPVRPGERAAPWSLDTQDHRSRLRCQPVSTR